MFNPCNGIAGIPPENQPFNWRRVCCSAECGSKFINSVLESRGLTNDGEKIEGVAVTAIEPTAKPRQKTARRPKQETIVEQDEPAELVDPTDIV